MSGYLLPMASPIDDDDLSHFLHDLVQGVTGLPGNLIRPRWQPEPGNAPAFNVTWAAIGETDRDSDTFATELVSADGETIYTYRNQIITVLLSVYGPQARGTAELLINGFSVGQNREVMQLNGFGLVGVDKPIITADQLHNQWVRRVDVPFRLRRGQLYRYSVPILLGASVTINEDNQIVEQINVNLPLPMFGFGLDTSLVKGWGIGIWI